MSDNSIAVVSKQRDYPEPKAKAKEILDWLISRDIVKPEPSNCILSAEMGYAVSEGAAKVVKVPNDLPFSLTVNGLEIVSDDNVFDPGSLFDEENENFELVMSNLGFVFWNWPTLSDEFVSEIQARLGCGVEIVNAHY